MQIPQVSYNRLTLLALEDWAIIIALIVVTLSIPACYPITCLLIAGRYNALGIIAHDLSHQNLTDKSVAFRICEFLSGYPVSSSATAMAYHHNRHHRFTNTKKDPYYDNTPREKFLAQSKFVFIRGILLGLGWFLRPLFAPFALVLKKLRNGYARTFLRDNSGLDLTHSQEVLNCLKEDLPLFVINCGLIYLMTINSYVIYFYAVPLLVAGIFSMMRLISEHDRELHEEVNKQNILRSTFDNHLGLIERMLISPRNVGFHVAHHMYPTAPLYALPLIAKTYIDSNKETI